MDVTLESKIKFEKLCDVLEKISKAHVGKKTVILERFIQKLKLEFLDMDASFFPILRLILPDLERERKALNLKEKSLATLYAHVFCLGKSGEDKLKQYKAPNAKNIKGCDFAEKACSVLRKYLSDKSSGFTIKEINTFLDNISSRKKEDKMFILLKKVNALEFKWITRIILKSLKLGIKSRKILDVYHPNANSAYNVSSDLRHVCDILSNPQSEYRHDIKVFFHFKPMLLERSKIENVNKLFNNGEQYFVQSKYDGERSQVHIKDGKYKYFTRQGYDITNNSGFGETSSSGFLSSVFGRLLKSEVTSVILDGELMGWHKEKKMLGSKGMNYDVKKLSEKSHYQQCFIAYDIVMYNDTLIYDKPYEERLEILKNVFNEEEGCLLLCKSTKVSGSEELRKIFNESMKNKEEGIVIKKCDSKYKPNVRDGTGCYKIKAEYSEDLVQDVDLIILGGYYGDGKYMGLIKSFLMGVAPPPNNPGENPVKFLSVVSVSNGFSMDALKEIEETFKNKWQKTCPENVVPPRLDPPDLWICPENSIILTIRATEMIRSNNYPTHYSLRFPRVVNVRTDKPWYSVCTTKELLSLVKDTQPIQKLTKRDVNYEDMEDVPEIKVRKITKKCLIKYEEKPRRSNIFDDPPVLLTRLFDNKEICVMNGNDELPKEKIEEVLLQHSAKVVKNPLKENYCIIVGNAKTAMAVCTIQSKKYNVVTLDWFKRVTKEENWSRLQDFFPWDLLSCCESTKQRLTQYYDDYYDHYTVDADEESLLRSFKKIEEMAQNIEFDCIKMKEIDEELFDNQISPYSLFRNIVGYFDDKSDLSKLEFRFMGGTIRDLIDDSVTHVFISKNAIGLEVQNLIDSKSQTSLKIIKSEWILECFKRNAIIPCSEYLIQ